MLCLLIGGSGVGYVWEKSQIEELGKQRARREQEVSALQIQNKRLREQLAMMCLPKFLEAKVKELNLGLVQAQPSQKWVLRENPAQLSLQAGERQYAANDRSGGE